MQALVGKSDYFIELKEPIETNTTSKQEDQITELAKKIFSDLCPRLSERINQYQEDSINYTLEETNLKKTWRYWALQNSFKLTVMEGVIGALLLVGDFSLSMLHIVSLEAAIPTSILAGFFVSDAYFGLSHAMLNSPVQKKLDSLKEQIELANSNKECTEKIVDFTNRLAEFLDDWEKFQSEPDDAKLAKTLLRLDVLSKAHGDLLNSVMQKLGKVDEAFNEFIQKMLTLFSFDKIKLFLMEEASSFLKGDSISIEWKKLKNSSHKNFLWLDKNAEPWLSLKVDNPDKNSYLYFFEHRKEYKIDGISQKIKAIFSENLKKFLDKTEAIYIDLL